MGLMNSVNGTKGLFHYGNGTQWDRCTLGTRHNEIGTLCEWDAMGLVNSVNGTQGTVSLWEWDTMGLVHSGNGTHWEWYRDRDKMGLRQKNWGYDTLGLGYNGTG